MINIVFVLIIIAIIFVSIDVVLTLIKMKKLNDYDPEIIEKYEPLGKHFHISVEAKEGMTKKQISDELIIQMLTTIRDNTYIDMHDNVYSCDFWLYTGDQDVR